jgi:hypothetical protein
MSKAFVSIPNFWPERDIIHINSAKVRVWPRFDGQY